MISFCIKVITVVSTLIALCTFDKKKKNMRSVLRAIKTGYLDVLNSWGTVMKKILQIYGGFIVFLFFCISFEKCCLDPGKGITVKSIMVSIIIWILITLIIYIFIGTLLAIYSKTIEAIANVNNSKISTKMMISFLTLGVFAFFTFFYENEMKENLSFLLCGLIMCYILNIEILFKMVRNPFCVVGDKISNKRSNRSIIIFSSAFVVVMIIVNLYLLVLWTYYSFEGAYRCSLGNETELINNWTLLYYTIISFTTIGYGDVTPALFGSQVVAIVIAITSVICLVIFISSVLSEKKEIFNDRYAQQEKES